jgi:hypothetical protein
VTVAVEAEASVKNGKLSAGVRISARIADDLQCTSGSSTADPVKSSWARLEPTRQDLDTIAAAYMYSAQRDDV